MVSPNGKTSGASLVISAISTISDPIASPISTILESLDIASTLISLGNAIDGVVVSTNEISCWAVVIFPEASVAVHVTMVSPNGKNSGASFSIAKTPTISELCASPRITEFDAMSSAS